MTDVIEIEKLSKKYLIYHEDSKRQTTLVETLANKVKKCLNPFKKQPPKPSFEEFWALKDFSCKIQEGDRFGIIGKNGAGKSTLLKILSRITEPSSGRIKIRGKISCLLEVGTGFHPELTGRENIFLNGAILGMLRKEIKAKFDEIVAFAEIEKFLDTPVKRYSSGMYTRLGFAIAAHLDPDILIVDEVLAVGDQSFQEKCLKKLNDLGTSGRTILFVSHDIGSMLSLCNKGVYLEKGCLHTVGRMDECVSSYLKNIKVRQLEWTGNLGDEHIRFYRFALSSKEGAKEFFYQHDRPFIDIEYEVIKPHPNLHYGVAVLNPRSQMIARSDVADDPETLKKFTAVGRHKVQFPLDASMFSKGDYSVRLECAIYHHKIILNDDIILKLPIFSQKPNPQFSQLAERNGVFLGYHWSHT